MHEVHKEQERHSGLILHQIVPHQVQPQILAPEKKQDVHSSGQITIFHQARFPWNSRGFPFQNAIFWGVSGRVEVAIIWPVSFHLSAFWESGSLTFTTCFLWMREAPGRCGHDMFCSDIFSPTYSQKPSNFRAIFCDNCLFRDFVNHF